MTTYHMRIFATIGVNQRPLKPFAMKLTGETLLIEKTEDIQDCINYLTKLAEDVRAGVKTID